MILSSKEFTSKAECRKEIRKLKTRIKNCFDSNNVSIPHGIIILVGYISKYNDWCILTQSIEQFNKYIDCDGIKKYKLHTLDLDF